MIDSYVNALKYRFVDLSVTYNPDIFDVTVQEYFVFEFVSIFRPSSFLGYDN